MTDCPRHARFQRLSLSSETVPLSVLLGCAGCGTQILYRFEPLQEGIHARVWQPVPVTGPARTRMMNEEIARAIA